MATKTPEMKRNDRRPYYRVQLTANDVPVNLTGIASVRCYMRTLEPNATLKVDAPATIVDAVNGIVEYQWAAGDTNTSGTYVLEFEVLWSTGVPQTFPSSGYFPLTITEDLK